MLRPEDVHHGHIHVREETAKWGKFRKVPVGTDVLALLDEQRVRRGLGVRSEERYFVVCPAYLDQLFMKASILSQMKPTICPHDLRRTYGSRMAFKVPPKALQLLMGHADIKTTMEHYVDVDAAKLASVVASVGSPLVG
jgi:integrase